MIPDEQNPSTTSRRRVLAIAGVLPVLGMLPAGTALAAGTSTTGSPDLPDYAPVPPFAKGPVIPGVGYYVAQVHDNLYWITDPTQYVAAFLTTREGVVLFDAPPTIGGNLQRAINSVTQPLGYPGNVTHLVHSHFHADHIGASGLFGDDVVRIGHSENRRLLLELNDPNRPAPQVTFEDRFTLDIGGERVNLAFHGPNHTIDSIFAHFPRHDALMLVDVVIPAWVPFADLNVSQDILEFIGAPAAALDYSWDSFIGGHIKLGTRSDIVEQQQYIADLTTAAENAINTVNRAAFFERYPDNGWAATKTYFDALVAATTAPVVAKYTGVLAGADVYTDSNAFVLLESLRLESGYGSAVHP